MNNLKIEIDHVNQKIIKKEHHNVELVDEKTL